MFGNHTVLKQSENCEIKNSKILENKKKIELQMGLFGEQGRELPSWLAIAIITSWDEVVLSHLYTGKNWCTIQYLWWQHIAIDTLPATLNGNSCARLHADGPKKQLAK